MNKKFTRRHFKVLTVMLGVFMFFSFFVGAMPIIKKERNLNLIQAFADETETDETTSEELKIGAVLRSFDEYEVFEDEEDSDLIHFIGKRTIQPEERDSIEGLDMASENSDIVIDYDISCYLSSTEVYVSMSYIQDENVLVEDELYITDIDYDEDTGVGYLFFENGNCLSTEDIFNSSASEVVNHFQRSVTIAAAVASSIVVVSTIIVYVCVVVVIRLFFGWIRSWVRGTKLSYSYVPKVVEQTTIYQRPSFLLNKIRYELEPKDRDELEQLPKKTIKNHPIYYVACSAGISYEGENSDTTVEANGLYIGPAIDEYTAYVVLTTPTVMTAEQDGNRFSYVLSIYSEYETDIIEVVSATGFSSSTPRQHPERHSNSYGYGLYHYHPADCYTVAVPILKNGQEVFQNYRPHAFFLINNESYWLSYS